MKFELNLKLPFVHRLSTNHVPDIEKRASVNMPSATLEDFFKLVGWETDTQAGISVDQNTALNNSAVWRAINLLSSSIAQLPISLYRKEKNGDIIEASDHPAYWLLKEPNGLQTGYIFRESLQYFVCSWGNGYAWIEGGDYPKALYILDSKDVEIIDNKTSLLYRHRPTMQGYNSKDMLHIPALSLDGKVGKSPIQVARESIATGLATQRFGNKFFANGAKQSGILKHPQNLSDNALERLRNTFEKKMKGDEGGTMILEEGMDYVPISIPPEDAQFLETRKFSINEIARWYGIPPHLLGDLERATFSNIEHQGIEFVVYSLMPWIRRWEDELNRKLLKGDEKRDHFFKFNVNGLLRGDAKTRFEAYRLGLDMGIYNIDEVRALEEMNQLPGGIGKKYLVQLNRTDLDKI